MDRSHGDYLTTAGTPAIMLLPGGSNAALEAGTNVNDRVPFSVQYWVGEGQGVTTSISFIGAKISQNYNFIIGKPNCAQTAAGWQDRVGFLKGLFHKKPLLLNFLSKLNIKN